MAKHSLIRFLLWEAPGRTEWSYSIRRAESVILSSRRFQQCGTSHSDDVLQFEIGNILSISAGVPAYAAASIPGSIIRLPDVHLVDDGARLLRSWQEQN